MTPKLSEATRQRILRPAADVESAAGRIRLSASQVVGAQVLGSRGGQVGERHIEDGARTGLAASGPVSTQRTSVSPPSMSPAGILGVLRFWLGLWEPARC